MDGLTNPNRIPSADPKSPIEEWPDGRGMTVTSGRIVRRLDPGILAEAAPEPTADELDPSKDEPAEQPS